eukprot:UN32430
MLDDVYVMGAGISLVLLIIYGPCRVLFLTLWLSEPPKNMKIFVICGCLGMWSIYKTIVHYGAYEYEFSFRKETTQKTYPQLIILFIYLICYDEERNVENSDPLKLFSYFTLFILFLCCSLDRLISYRSAGKRQTIWSHCIYSLEVWADVYLRITSIILFGQALSEIRILLPVSVYIFEVAAGFCMSIEAAKEKKSWKHLICGILFTRV